jgi:hypothetical protein
MVFVGLLGLRWINGVCWVCGGLTRFAGFAVMVFVGLLGFFYGGLRWINSALRWWICT